MLGLDVGQQTAAALMLGLQLCKQTTTAVASVCCVFSGEHRAADKHCENNHYAQNVSTHLLFLQFRTGNQTRQILSQSNGGLVPLGRDIVRDQGRLESREHLHPQ